MSSSSAEQGTSDRPHVSGLLFAHIETDWWHNVVSGLVDEIGSNNIATTDDGTEVLAALTDPRGAPQVVIAGPPLRKMGALEAIYLSHKQFPKNATRKSIGLVSDVRSDLELLGLVARRGVNLLVFYNDPIEATVARITQAYYGVKRGNKRHGCKIEAEMKHGEVSFPVVIRDISASGCQVSAAPESVEKLSISIGKRFQLSCDFDGEKFDIQADVRRVFDNKRLFKGRTGIGLQFHAAGFEEAKSIEGLVRKARVASQVRLSQIDGGTDYDDDVLDELLARPKNPSWWWPFGRRL